MTSHYKTNLFTASIQSLMIFPSYVSLQLIFFPITMGASSLGDAQCIHLTCAEDRTATMSCLYASSIHSQMLAFNHDSALIRINFGNDASVMKESDPKSDTIWFASPNDCAKDVEMVLQTQLISTQRNEAESLAKTSTSEKDFSLSKCLTKKIHLPKGSRCMTKCATLVNMKDSIKSMGEATILFLKGDHASNMSRDEYERLCGAVQFGSRVLCKYSSTKNKAVQAAIHQSKGDRISEGGQGSESQSDVVRLYARVCRKSGSIAARRLKRTSSYTTSGFMSTDAPCRRCLRQFGSTSKVSSDGRTKSCKKLCGNIQEEPCEDSMPSILEKLHASTAPRRQGHESLIHLEVTCMNIVSTSTKNCLKEGTRRAKKINYSKNKHVLVINVSFLPLDFSLIEEACATKSCTTHQRSTRSVDSKGTNRKLRQATDEVTGGNRAIEDEELRQQEGSSHDDPLLLLADTAFAIDLEEKSSGSKTDPPTELSTNVQRSSSSSSSSDAWYPMSERKDKEKSLTKRKAILRIPTQQGKPRIDSKMIGGSSSSHETYYPQKPEKNPTEKKRRKRKT